MRSNARASGPDHPQLSLGGSEENRYTAVILWPPFEHYYFKACIAYSRSGMLCQRRPLPMATSPWALWASCSRQWTPAAYWYARLATLASLTRLWRTRGSSRYIVRLIENLLREATEFTFFADVPSSTLSLGSSLNASNIKEGDDVYFECGVRASPGPYKITWRHNGRELNHNVAKKVIISNQSLVLQKVTRADTGVYTCTAHNSEGDGVSNSINLNIKCKKGLLLFEKENNIVIPSVKPFCKPDQTTVYGVGKREKIHVTCEVVANPTDNIYFNWVFNSSSERLDLQENLIRTQGSKSVAEHMPQVE